MRARRLGPLIAVAVLAAPGCQDARREPPPAVSVQPGAPGQPTHELPAGTLATKPAEPAPKDVTFMQGMIHHHAQAIEMVRLLKTRTNREDMKRLGQRIEISQNDEIKMMKTWLTDRGAAVPLDHGHGAMMMDGAVMPMMPGMLSPAEMDALDKARGPVFDRLFLEGMIRHHEGALAMVDDLLQSPGAGQESLISDFVTHVDADQRMEIRRMGQMLRDAR